MLNNLEQWKTIIVSLPDDDFFAIMRNYLGEIKTPFNKHILIDRLLAFLTREETVERIVTLISNDDAYLLTLIYFLDEPDIKTLYSFIKESKSFLELQNRLLNLEERLLIFKEPETGRIKLSPIFRETLIERILDTKYIFSSAKAVPENIALPWFNEALITAVISFINFMPDIYKLDGEIKKRPGESLEEIFPSILEKTEQGNTRFSIITDTLSTLDLISNDRGKLLIEYENVLDFSSLPAKERYSLLWSAAVCGKENIALLDQAAFIITSFIDSIPEDTAFSEQTLLFLLKTVSRDHSINTDLAEKIVKTLIRAEAITAYKDNTLILNPALNRMLSDGKYEEPDLIIQSSFSITAKPWINIRTGLPLAMSSCIKSFDLFSHYEISKKSCIGIRKIKMTYSDLLQYFIREGNGNIPQNIATSLKHWSEEYNTIQLYEGIMLVVSESRQVIIDHMESLKPYIKLHPAPSVYLFDREEQSEWSKILQEEGIPIIPEIKSFTVEKERKNSFESKQNKRALIPRINFLKNSGSETKIDTSFMDELYRTLDKRNLTPSEREEMRARIDKKLILFPKQIQKGIYRREIAEVGGLDYTGKIRLIHRAMESRTDILEIKSNFLSADKNRILIKPIRINNEKDKHILQASTLPEEEEIEIPVGKISYIRLLKSSLYAPVSG